ncbi:MAG: aldose 1-epimerase family protein [Eubacteriales bacterium]|nr:aldose 1-epimerase family protein [Eubacteriales bacterium]
MEKAELFKRTGSMQQVAYIRPVEYQEGRSAGLRAWQVKNGQLFYQVMAGKCLDMAELSYKGINMSFLSKPGLQGRNHYDTNGEEALRSIMGGFFFTAGLENICAPCSSGGKDYPMHGRIRTTPGEHLAASCSWENDNYVMRVSGEMREAELFGENMVLRRSIETVYGENKIVVEDEIENEGFREEPFMILYHINLGYPFLDEHTKLYIPAGQVRARDKAAEGHEKDYDRMDSPKENETEYVFIHELENPSTEGGENMITVLVINEMLQIGLKLEYDRRNLPYFMEWKSIAAGDYVIGLEPSNSSVYGRLFHEKEKTLHKLKPFAKEMIRLEFTVLDGTAEIEKEIKKYKEQYQEV